MISFDNLNLNDRVNYIVTHISQGRGMANRSIGLASVASREGVKILSDEYREKIIVISGIVFASDSVTFIDIMDAMKMKLAGVGKQLIIDDSDRYYVASVRNMSISDMGAEVTSADFTIEFTCEIPFALGNLHTTNYIVPSGVTTVSGLISISGTAPARPQIQYNIPDGNGTSRTTTSGMIMYHDTTGNYVTWSGTNASNPLIYSGSVIFNYNNSSVTVRGAEEDWAGLFSLWDTGENAWKTTFSGMAVGGTLSFTYNPRYY
jgi:predicted phage tail component-like protein